MKRSFKKTGGEDESVFGRKSCQKNLFISEEKTGKDFVSQMAPEEEVDDLDREDVLRLNRIKRRFSKKQIERIYRRAYRERCAGYRKNFPLHQRRILKS